MRKAMIIAVALVSVAIASGCGSTNTNELPPPPTLGPISVVRAPEDITRPIDAYTPTQSQVDILEHAEAISFAQCMQGFGFHEPRSIVPMTNMAQFMRDQKTRTQLYGFFDPEVAPIKGYDTLRIPTTSNAVDHKNQDPPSELEKSLITGRDASGKDVTNYQGKPVPQGGCKAAAANAVGGAPPDVGAVSVLPDGGPKVPQTDPRISKMNQQWSACMKVKGFSYATPVDAIVDHRWQPDLNNIAAYAPSADQIATATADVDCKISLNLVGYDMAVVSAYDNQYIETHVAALTDYKNNLDGNLKKATAIIANDTGD